MPIYQSINPSIHDLAWLAGWLVPGEARIRPWKGFWSICKEIMLRESNLRSPDKIENFGWRAGWRSLAKPGFGSGEVFALFVQKFCKGKAI